MTVEPEGVERAIAPVSAPAGSPIASQQTQRRRELTVARNLPRALGLALVAAILAIGATTNGFLSVSNLIDIVQAASAAGIAALGLTFITISGNYFTLSLEQTVACGAVTFALLVTHGFGVVPAIAVTLIIAAATGAIQGAVVAMGANPIIVTLGAGAAMYGILLTMTGGLNVTMAPNPASGLGTGRLIGIPYIAIIFAALCIITEAALRWTRFGRSVCLVGANRATARRSGLRTGLVICGAFTLCGAMSALVGILQAAQFSEAGAEQFSGFTFTVVAAVLISGISLKGGAGSMLRSAAGACVIALLVNVCVLRGYSYGVQLLVEGLAILIGVSVHHMARIAKEGA